MRTHIIMAAFLLAAGFSSHAATVVFDPDSTATLRVANRIDGLVINETGFSGVYDVIFTGEALDDVRAAGGHPLLDLPVSSTQRASIADAIIDLVVNELNTAGANRVGTVPFAVNQTGYLPYAEGTVADTFLSDRTFFNTRDESWSNLAGAVGISSVTNGFVTISLVPVPLPAGLPLLLSALGGLGLIASRRRKAAA